VRSFPQTRASKSGTLKKRYFAAIGSPSVKTVANKYIHIAFYNKHWSQLFSFINIDNLERPWNSKRRVL